MVQPIKIKNFIDGRWVEAIQKRTFERENPAFTDRIVAIVPRSTAQDVDAAVAAARKAFPAWRDLPAPKRGEILFRVSELLLKNKDRLGDLVANEMGKVKKESYGDVQEAIDMGYFMAAEGRRLYGETMPSELPDKSIRTIRQPLGVFAVLTPWNFPMAIPAWKLFPALVSGNTVVFKPSQYTSACAYEMVKIFEEAGLPPGVLNLVTGFGDEIGDYLVQHPGINGVTFTGSTAVGKKIGAFCGANLRKHSLEMGGKNVIIVMDDANLDLAVEGCIWAAFGTTGQRCTAASRIIVHKKVYEEFRDKLVKAAQNLKLGYALDKVIDMGPLVNADALNKTEKYMEIARKEDKAKIICGGKRATGKGLEKGYFFEPTIFEEVTPAMRIFCEEIFGPATALTVAKDLDQAIEYANSSDYGLSASIFSTNVYNTEKAANLLQTGLVYVNTSTIGAEIQTPFGGLKNTGNGHRDAGGKGGAIDTFTEMKVISVDYSGKIQKAQIQENKGTETRQNRT
ncbi:MAG TPA: aldehyde dehydrogenase family protein [Candidatus Gracilibacteria bacterium]|nr:aldehyde dehydrogenase family protein [Candidatus Gracilibacteria bacterium]